MPISADDPRVKRVGFAKLVGENVDHVMRKYEIVLGRKSKATPIDVVLGEMMSVSRQHAKIYYNFDTQRFEMEVIGKNGVVVDGVLHEPGCKPVHLKSQAFLQIGAEVSFYFLLPKKLSKIFRVPKRKREEPVGNHAAKEGEAPRQQTSQDTQPSAPPSILQKQPSTNSGPIAGLMANQNQMPASMPASSQQAGAPTTMQLAAMQQAIIAQQAQQAQLQQQGLAGAGGPPLQTQGAAPQMNPIALQQMQMLQQMQQYQQIQQMQRMQQMQQLQQQQQQQMAAAAAAALHAANQRQQQGGERQGAEQGDSQPPGT